MIEKNVGAASFGSKAPYPVCQLVKELGSRELQESMFLLVDLLGPASFGEGLDKLLLKLSELESVLVLLLPEDLERVRKRIGSRLVTYTPNRPRLTFEKADNLLGQGSGRKGHLKDLSASLASNSSTWLSDCFLEADNGRRDYHVDGSKVVQVSQAAFKVHFASSTDNVFSGFLNVDIHRGV